MIAKYLNPPYQFFILNPIVIFTQRIPPQNITLYSCIMGLMVMFALMLNFTSAAIIFLLASGFLDTLDGAIARKTGTTTELGTILDIVSDRIVELAIIIGLYLVDPAYRGGVCLMILGSCFLCITSFLVVGIFTKNKSEKNFHYGNGLIERPEAFIFFGLMILMPQDFFVLGVIFALLVMLTTYFHLKDFIDAELIQPKSDQPEFTLEMTI